MTPQPEPTGRLGFSRVAPIGVLIAKDFALDRRFILSTLASMPDLQVIGGGTCCKKPVFPLRRHTSRVDAPEVVWVIWSCDGHDEISHVRDLSFGGLFVETASPRAVGATAVLDFLVQEGQIGADAVVRHLRPGHGVGLEFTAMTDGDNTQLATLLNRLSRSS